MVNTHINLDSYHGELTKTEAKRWHAGGGISLKPTSWATYALTGKGEWVRFGLHKGGRQNSDSLQWHRTEQGVVKSFRTNNRGMFPPGYYGLYGRTTRTGSGITGNNLRVNLQLFI